MTTADPIHEAAILAGMRVAADYLKDSGMTGSAGFLWSEILRREKEREQREAAAKQGAKQ